MPELAVGPRIKQRPGDNWSMALGPLGGPVVAQVDGGGLVELLGRGFSVDWWVNVEEKWVVPAREAAVRQGRIGPGPVAETILRAGGGDIRHRVYALVLDGSPWVAIEIHNDRSDPVAVGLALRPYGLKGQTITPADSAALQVKTEVRPMICRGDEPVLILPRIPSEAGGSSQHDLLVALEAGQSLDWPDQPTAPDQPTGLDQPTGPVPNMVAVLPLAHKTMLRYLVPVESISPEAVANLDPRLVPDSDMVARGWTSVVDSQTQFAFADPGVTARFNSARARLLLSAADLGQDLVAHTNQAGHRLMALTYGGYSSEVEAALGELVSAYRSGSVTDPTLVAQIVEALAPAVALTHWADPAPLVELAMGWTRQVEKKGDAQAKQVARRGLAWLALVAGDPVGAAGLWADSQGSSAGRGSSSGQDEGDGESLYQAVVDQLEAANPLDGWGDDDLASAARFVIQARRLVVDDSVLGGDLQLLSHFPTAWRGGPMEFAGLPVLPGGNLGFAIRWHGPRPALLWQLANYQAKEVTLVCPGLDPGWSQSAPRGETLLAGSSDPLPAPALPGESFS